MSRDIRIRFSGRIDLWFGDILVAAMRLRKLYVRLGDHTQRVRCERIRSLVEQVGFRVIPQEGSELDPDQPEGEAKAWALIARRATFLGFVYVLGHMRGKFPLGARTKALKIAELAAKGLLTCYPLDEGLTLLSGAVDEATNDYRDQFAASGESLLAKGEDAALGQMEHARTVMLGLLWEWSEEYSAPGGRDA